MWGHNGHSVSSAGGATGGPTGGAAGADADDVVDAEIVDEDNK